MNIAVVKETCPGETRVALVPERAASLIQDGHRVLIEASAGEAAGWPDEAYARSGAVVVAQREVLILEADAVVMVRGPGSPHGCRPEDTDLLQAGQVLIAFLDPLAGPTHARSLAEAGVTAFALELVPRIERAQSMDALSSMAMLTGYKSVMLAADSLPRIFPEMITAAGSLSAARVFVLGAGVAGLQACATARRMGAVVSAYDIRPAARRQIRSMGVRMVEFNLFVSHAEDSHGYAILQNALLYRRQQEKMAGLLAETDAVITSAAIPGHCAPMLISGDMVRDMAPGSVIVDLAAATGGNCELTEPGRTVVRHGVTIIGATDLPSRLPHQASMLLAGNITALFGHITDSGGRWAIDPDDEIIAGMMVCRDGAVVNPRVLERLTE